MNIMVKTIKEENREAICFFKIGGFYHCYGRDAYILSYLLEYKLLGNMPENVECGFPINTLDKVIEKIEKREIDFLIIDNKNDFKIEKNSKNKMNKYNEFYEKSRNYINYKYRINSINDFLLENIEKKNFRKLLGKIEDIIAEEEIS